MALKTTLAIFSQLMRKDLLQFARTYKSKLFDTGFLFFTNVIVFAYFLPQQGLQSSYGPFIMIGAIASFGLFDVVGYVSELIFDIEGPCAISYTLAMPIPSWVVFLQIAVRWAVQSFLLVIPLFFVGKLLLWNHLNLSGIHWPLLILMYISINCFFGVFGLWIASLIKTMGNLSHLFLRFVNPIFMFGAYFYTWHASYQLAHWIGCVILINPMVYVMEGMRAAALGQAGYLPFWLCFFAVWAYILVLGTHAILRLQKRLDCI